MADINQIIATVCPDRYYRGSPSEKKEFKSLIEKEGFTKAANKAKSQSDRDYEIVYDSPSETLEPVYFWIVDMMGNLFGGKVEKLIDNFSASPGGGYFSEMGQRKSLMQKNVTDTLGMVNTVIKSVINIIYDLKDFEIRLEHYKAAKSDKKDEAEAGILGLKQIWMDNVDIKRGQGSINALATGNLMFITLRDAFMAAKSVEEIENLDLNDRVKRMLKPRLAEFLQWKDLSEKELEKRYSIERSYLKSQVNTLQLYSRWVKPYLKAASQLEMKEQGRNPAMVTAFNTIYLELTLMGKVDVDFKDAQLSYKIPKGVKEPKRKYYSVCVVDFKFRGIPQKVGQHYVFGGRVNVTFKPYSLNEDELKLFEQELKKADIEDAFSLIEGATTESIDELKKDIDYFLKKPEEREADEKKEDEKKKKSDDTNPFSAMFDLFKNRKSDKKKKEDEKKEMTLKDIKKDAYVEGIMREIAKNTAEELCFNLYDVYKKAHQMASHDSPYE